MDIKALVKNIIPFTPVAKSEANSKEIKTENSPDRDAHGGSEGGHHNPGRRIKEEEVSKILQALGELPGFKENQLRAEVSQESDQYIFRILDISGKVVRRIPEVEASKLLTQQDSIKGQIFSRAL